MNEFLVVLPVGFWWYFDACIFYINQFLRFELFATNGQLSTNGLGYFVKLL